MLPSSAPAAVTLSRPPRYVSLWDTCPGKNHWFRSRGEGRRLIETNPRILKIVGMILNGGKGPAKLSHPSLTKPL